ncbi:MAG: cytochrome b/b6 domain-containing protein [Prolixibacteraceae bacterium]
MEKNIASSPEEISIFIQKNSTAIRIWHWLTFLVITSLILTVLMASTVLNPRKNVPVVQNVLKEKGITVDDKQSFAVAHMYDDKMWDIHKLLGYALTFLLLSRIIIEIRQAKEEKMQTRIKKTLLSYLQAPKDKLEERHYLIVKYSYILFYMILLIMVITGMLIAFGGDLGITGPTRHTIKEIHGFVQYVIYAFVFFHLAGVILGDLGKAKGIVSGMINGGK